MKRESRYAWFVVFCSFAIGFIIDGVAYTFGIFFAELMDEFKIAKVSGAWVPSIMTGMTFMTGPIVSLLTNRYGCRFTTITGTCMVAAGYFFSSFTSNMSTLYMTIGVMAGTGFGLIYLPAIVIITQYFDKRLALATGVAVSAAGIGSAVFAPLSEYLIRQHGWRKAMQAIALLSFISGLFALSFKNFENDDTETEYEEEASEAVYAEICRQKMVKFNDKNDLCAEEEKLMKNDLDKLCNGNALTKQNKINFSQNSLNSLTSNEKHNRIINSHLSVKQLTDRNKELNEQDNQMLIPIDEQNNNEDYKENQNEEPFNDEHKSDKTTDHDQIRTELESKQFRAIVDSNNLNGNLLANNLATSLNTNLNNVARTNEPRLSLDNSANYKLQHQLKQHHLQLNNENQPKTDNNSYDNLITINTSDFTDQNLDTSLSSQLNQSKSSNSLHHNLAVNRIPSKKPTSNRNLNNIVLYSTSLTSINYCFATSDPIKESNTFKHKSLSNQKLTNVLTSPLHKESVATEKKRNPLIAENDSDKLTYFQIKRRGTLRKILIVGKYINILLSWNLLRDRIFLWFAISNFLTSLGYYVPYFYIKQRCALVPGMQTKSADCSYLLALIGFSSTIGRILFGFISDFKRFNRIYIYAHCLTICGFVTMLTIFANNYYLLAIYSTLFGLTSGAFVSLTTVIIIDLLGPEYVSNAFGLLLLFQGVASLCGPPIVGLTYDYTSSYDTGFLFIGSAILISGIMLYFVPCIREKSIDNQYG